MEVRRCGVFWLESRESAHFELADLLAGNTGVVSEMKWIAHAPHLASPVEVSVEEAQFLGGMSPTDWVDPAAFDAAHQGMLGGLLHKGLVVDSDDRDGQSADPDAMFRTMQWHAPAAIYHAQSRWQGVDALRELATLGLDTSVGLRTRYGAPPPLQSDRGDGRSPVPLPACAEGSTFDALLDARATCRNFDPDSLLSKDQFARVLARVFGSRGQVCAADDFDVMKRTSPSGGAMHPTEAWLIVQRVEGVASGLYHYRPLDHAIQPLPWSGNAAELKAFARLAVGGQDYFAEAHVLVVLAPRFIRNFWKYRNHGKAYRVCILDVGHLSQTLLLSSAEQGLGAFVTAAINEIDIEEAFGLASHVDGPVAVCGFGLRAEQMSTYELDPTHSVWPR